MYQVGNGHFIAKMICIARIPQKYMYIMKRNRGCRLYLDHLLVGVEGWLDKTSFTHKASFGCANKLSFLF